jgi:ParB-like chromosome segregation protein Spo0J
MEGLAYSIQRFGCVEPIIVNVREGRNRIVGGHQRHKALTAAGVAEAMCVTVDQRKPKKEKQKNKHFFTLICSMR